ncbi:FAD-dependent oxidoreductase [Candidatus Woesearchaeota archaeon]|nr:MAG: FAD-dependent oxidoreductase [Candidatus Woesearchaeota archaeon]
MRVKASVKEVVQETPHVRLVRLTWPDFDKFSFRPGQWVGVWSEDFKDENNRPIRRAFSIASLAREPYLELCIARGKGLSRILQDSCPGDVFWVDGPYGVFSLKPSREYLFIAGGTGIAPFRPMVDQALLQGKKTTLIFSMKTPSDFIYRSYFRQLEQNPLFTLVPTITSGEDFPAWKGRKGRCTAFLNEYWKEGIGCYICGPSGLVNDAKTVLLSLGQKEEDIFLDKWE